MVMVRGSSPCPEDDDLSVPLVVAAHPDQEEEVEAVSHLADEVSSPSLTTDHGEKHDFNRLMKDSFDVDTVDVWNRCVCGLTSLERGGLRSLLEDGKPDLYGPLWIIVSLSFVIGVLSSSIQAFARALVILGTFTIGSPICMRCCSAMRSTTAGVVYLICVYGYGLMPFLPCLTLRGVLPLLIASRSPALDFVLAIVLPTFLSGTIVIGNITPVQQEASGGISAGRTMVYLVLALQGMLSWSLLAFCILPNSSSPQAGFDFFVLAMSYQPEFCSNTKCGYPRGSSSGEAKELLTIHGLWPEWNNGTWPSSCSNEELSLSTIVRVGQEKLDRYWPNARAPNPSNAGYTSFWEHEWSKHGTCSGLSQVEYFKTTLDHFLITPQSVRKHIGTSMPKEDLVDAFGGPQMVVTICSFSHLSEVRVCFARDSATYHPTSRIACPSFVLEQDTCMSEIILLRGALH